MHGAGKEEARDLVRHQRFADMEEVVCERESVGTASWPCCKRREADGRRRVRQSDGDMRWRQRKQEGDDDKVVAESGFYSRSFVQALGRSGLNGVRPHFKAGVVIIESLRSCDKLSVT